MFKQIKIPRKHIHLSGKNGQAISIKYLVLLVLLCVLAAGCSSTDEGASAAQAEQLTEPTDAPEPTPAPAAQLIAFTSDRDGDQEIFTMNTDGGDVQQLTDNDIVDHSPAWSPDGQQIAYINAENKGWPNGDIYVMNADGSDTQLIIFEQANLLSWSPDGQQITYSSPRDGYKDIYVINADGSDMRQVTDTSYTDNDPKWSPDGQQIIYASSFPIEIFVVSPEGGEVSPLLDIPTGWDPAWSKDGQQIAFVSSKDGDQEIYAVNLDGSNLRQLTDNDALERDPTWSPDGQQIVFASDRDGDLEIFVMDADGSNVRQLTDNKSMDIGPTWSPVP